MTERVLIVDDEKDIRDLLVYRLGEAGFETEAVGLANEALAAIERNPPTVLILDLMLPDLPGTEVCKRLRLDPARRDLAILMLTARGEEMDRVVGLEIGADDYVVKPFSVRELVLRVKAVLRRAEPGSQGEAVLTFGRLRIDRTAHRVFVDEQEVALTALEFKLLTTLIERKNRVQSRDTLLNDVWGIHMQVETRTIDTHVKRLREKLGAAGAYIHTVRGVGYRFAESPDESE